MESLLSVGVVAAGLTVIGTLQMNQMDFEKAAVTAQQHRIVHYAARRYVRDFLGGLVAKAKTGPNQVITLDLNDLTKRGYIPDFMLNNGVIRANPYGQSYQILIRAMGDGTSGPELELLTLAVGGRHLSATTVGRIVSVMGAEAGMVSQDGRSIDGAYGSWQIDTEVLPDAVRPPPNTLAALAFYRPSTGVYVNPYQVNIPAMEDRYEALPKREGSKSSPAHGADDTHTIIIGAPPPQPKSGIGLGQK